MTFDRRINRRILLKTVVVAGGYGLARPLNVTGATADSHPIVDTHVYLGEWPHAYLADCEPAALVALLRRHGVSQAWAGSFEGLFHKDVAGVNERLAEACETAGAKFLDPFGTINPTLPDWEDDVRRCDEKHRMPGIRLHPNYHGYTLDDSRFVRLLQLATERSLLVQLVSWLDDMPHAWLTPKAPHVDFSNLAAALSKSPGARVVIAGAAGIVDDKLLTGLPKTSEVYFDLGGRRTKNASPSRKNRTAITNPVFGSAAPLQFIKDAFCDLESSGQALRSIKPP